MLNSSYGFLCTFFVLVLEITSMAVKNGSKDAIGFPEKEENNKLQNKDNRQPVFLPAQCPVNQLFYPGDQKADWICDCRPAHIYHPETDTCWPAFQRGPCKVGEYLILPKNSVIPSCEKSPCFSDGFVIWNNRCERLGSTIPCGHLFPAAAALGVNATNLEIDCVKLNVEIRFGDDQVGAVCPPGGKRGAGCRVINDIKT